MQNTTNIVPFLGRFLSEPCFLMDGWASGILQPVAADMDWEKRIKEAVQDKPIITPDGIGILPINGVLARRPSALEMIYDGVTDSDYLLNALLALGCDTTCKGVLLDVNSPGGFVTGTPELADAVAALSKPCMAWTGGLCCSAAYWIASQAKGGIVATRSAITGSIGAYTAIYNFTRLLENMGISLDVIKNKEGTFKAAGLKPLQDVQREQLQQSIESSYTGFKTDVLRARPSIEADTMRGQTFSGTEARDRKLIDSVGSMSFALGMLRNMIDEDDMEGEEDD